MKSKVLLTPGVIAAAVVAAWLALRKPQPAPAMVDPVDALVDAQNYAGYGDAPETLDQAVATLEYGSGIRIDLDWPELRAAGITRGARKPDFWITIGSSLRHLALAYSSTPTNPNSAPPLLFSATGDGAILVSIDHDAVRRLRIYDVHDLLADDYWGAPAGPPRPHNYRNPWRIDTLARTLALWIDSIEPQQTLHGQLPPPARIDTFGGKLLITTTAAKHRRIGRILAWLRTMKGSPH